MDAKKLLNTGNLKWFLGVFLAPYVLKKSLYKVEPGYQAIKFDVFSGVGTRVYREGYHLLIPFVQRPIIYDCKMKNHVFMCVCGTKDLQIVTLKTRLISRPNTDSLPDLYRLLGMNFEEKVLFSIVYEVAGAVISGFNASQLISQRDNISLKIKQKLKEKSKDFFIDLDDVALIDINFSKEFSDAIEKKQVAQQDAERMKFLVEQALEDKKSTIIRAMGEAESVRKFGEANKLGSAFLELRKIETARSISNSLKDTNNKVILDSNSLYMNLPAANANLSYDSISK
jgi:prohibitin 2